MTTETPPDTERRLGNLEGQVTQINSRLGDMLTLYERLDGKVDTRFADMDAKNDARFAAMEAKIDSLRNIILFASVGIIGTLIAAIATFALTS